MISWMQTHRKYLIVTIWISTIAFVGAGFVGWGAYSFGGGQKGNIAKVGEREISQGELQSSYNNIYNYYNQLLEGKLTQEKADEMKLQDVALNQLIKETLLLNYADDLGLSASEKEVAMKIHSIDNFKENGTFNKETYFKVLKAVNKKVKDFERDIRREIIINKLNDALALPYTELELKTIGASLFLQDKISVKLIDIQNSDINVSDEAMKTYWSENRTDFLSDKSYEIELIKVNSSNIEVTDAELEEFYRDKKYLFKDDDDKILEFEDAKERVKAKVQLKKAKKEILKKYLSFKQGKIAPSEKRTLGVENSDIPLEQIAGLKIGSYIKALELEDGYMTVKLVAINEPEPLEFEEAKDNVRDNLFKEKKLELLEAKAKLEAKELKDGKVLDFISREDADKVTVLSENEAKVFLEQLFLSSQKKGYYIFADKAIVYEIIDQKLSSTKELETNKEDLIKSIEALKSNTAQSMLIEKLEKKYKIVKYNKG